jgi:hypothetical protein
VADGMNYEPVPTTPLEWMKRLEKKLNADQRDLSIYNDYYEGRHPLSFVTPKFRDAFGLSFREFADNWCQVVPDAVEERLNVEGFRVGSSAAADKRAWRIWQANQLDSESQLAHTEALINGRCYILVWEDPDDPKVPAITVEHPTEMALITASGNRRRRLAALKRWVDDSGYVFGTLYLPDGLYKFQSENKVRSTTLTGTRSWVPRQGVDAELDNPLGVVPVIPLENRPRLLGCGVSEIANVIPIQAGINKLVMDMFVAAEFAAAPQRWATGLEIPKDPLTGQPIEMFKTMLDRFWNNPDKEGKFGAFPTADLGNFVNVIEMLVMHVASQSRTPPHYFNSFKGQFPSGESIKSAETGLVAKTRRKMRPFGEAWEEVMRLGFLVIGDSRRARVTDSQTIWADPESRSESEHIDALLKQKAFGVPDEILWEKAGYSPLEIERMKAINAAAPPDDAPDDAGGISDEPGANPEAA